MVAEDYDFSAHFMLQNPILWIAFGSLPSESTDASKRRQKIRQLGILRLFSTDENVPAGSTTWLAGTPRLFNPQQCDPLIICDWLQHCCHFHGNRCSTPAAWLLNSGIHYNFIDVELECVVTPLKDVQFVALSYVWGTVETLQALESNIDDLKRPGSLSISSSQIVPQTIRDAMRLCTLTRQRYLWVDRICIVQDDYKIKQQHLRAMAEIYAKAEFTIVAADGIDANHGLSGISRGVEERQKHLIPFPSKPLIRGTTWTIGDSFLSETVWSNRAWTFQEHVFSRRIIYINKFVNWVCNSARWTEALSFPLEGWQSKPTERDDNISPSAKLFVIDWPSLTYYAEMVEKYNVRQLTYDSDALNAFEGLLTQMCRGFPAGFFGGIPEFYFTICLLWQPKTGLRPRFNRPGTSFLPTWSWLGWSGDLDLQMWTHNTDAELPPTPYEVAISPIVEWYKASDRRRDSRIDDTCFIVRKHFLDTAAPPPNGWQKHGGEIDSGYKPYYTYHAHDHIGSTRKFRYPVPPFQRNRDIHTVDSSARYLYSSVQKAFFIFGAPDEDVSQQPDRNTDNSYNTFELPLYTTSSVWAGFIRVTVCENEALPIAQACEVVRIARGSFPLNGGKYSDVGLREAKPTTSSSCRVSSNYPFKGRALGVIWERIWEQAAPEEVDIKLG
ncbi:hypothetical protein GQX73_g10681 [Xylaria multiplex]|uniref:Heterokaryon incompatibility domain-containing protein n=1 Tax=Xylaria multiplex TaxID=323545 RepID=A0A7C8ISI9_9PEZI|nr:hypothetical protein GQX73_g10681 [Xylaria multiplex]